MGVVWEVPMSETSVSRGDLTGLATPRDGLYKRLREEVFLALHSEPEPHTHLLSALTGLASA